MLKFLLKLHTQAKQILFNHTLLNNGMVPLLVENINFLLLNHCSTTKLRSLEMAKVTGINLAVYFDQIKFIDLLSQQYKLHDTQNILK